MSKERELIKDMKILLECTDMGGLQRNTDVLIGRAIELLAQPEPKQLTPREGLAEFKKGYMIGYNVAVRDLKQKVDSVFNLIMEEDDDPTKE
jgi:hypothetical protein